MRSSHVPRPEGVPWDVGAGVAVPGATLVIGWIAPRRVRDHMAIVAEQRFDDGEDPRVRERPLACGAVVQHLVAELVAIGAVAL